MAKEPLTVLVVGASGSIDASRNPSVMRERCGNWDASTGHQVGLGIRDVPLWHLAESLERAGNTQ
jgi:hypothetical protein